MFHPALWKLTRLQWRGRFRQFLRSLKTIRGLIQLGLMIFLAAQFGFSMWITHAFGSQYSQVTKGSAIPADDMVALGMFAIICYSILFSTGEGVVLFTLSEMSFLFPAPITRRQLLAYKLFQSLIGMASVSILFACMSGPRIGMLPARFLGVLLTLCFISFLTVNVAFMRQIVEQKVDRWIRTSVAAVICATGLIAAIQLSSIEPVADLFSLVNAFKKSPVAVLALSPFQLFAKSMMATNWAAFAPYAFVLLLIDLGLVLLSFRLDEYSQEAVLTISEKGAERLKRIMTKGVWNALNTVDASVAGRRIPLPPFCAGIGPVFWQRMMTTFRSSTRILRILVVALLVAGGSVYILGRSNPNAEFAPGMGLGLMAYITFLISLSIQNDVERVGFLKSLPLASTSIVIGDLIGFPMLVSIVQSVFIIVEACFFPGSSHWLLASILLTLPFNFLVFGIDKLVFYVYPTRTAHGAPGDFQAAGKQMIFMMFKMLILFAFAAVMAAVTFPMAILLQSQIVIFVTAEAVLLMECIALIPLLKLAFERFDPSTTQIS